MGKLIVSEFITLDGVMEAPGGEKSHPHTGWAGDLMNEEQLEYKFNEVLEAESHLLGRVTYESFAGAWPQREGPFADKVNAMPKYVVTSSPEALGWNNCSPITGDIVAGIQQVKDRSEGSILVAGSRTLVPLLLDNNLVDEVTLMVFPIVLGSGNRFFPSSPNKRLLKLASAKTFSNGVQVNTYQLVQ